jgi:hypothetical protein
MFTADDRCTVLGNGRLRPRDVIELGMDKLGHAAAGHGRRAMTCRIIDRQLDGVVRCPTS